MHGLRSSPDGRSLSRLHGMLDENILDQFFSRRCRRTDCDHWPPRHGPRRGEGKRLGRREYEGRLEAGIQVSTVAKSYWCGFLVRFERSTSLGTVSTSSKRSTVTKTLRPRTRRDRR